MKNKSKKCRKEVVPKLILAVPQTFWQFLAIHYMNYLSLFSVFCGFFTLVFCVADNHELILEQVG